jgi:intracellular sulfur oxidation DsrE/DsrF family protein
MSLLKTIQHLFLFLFSSILAVGAFAQSPRAAALKANESKLIYPLIKGSTNTGVMPVENPTLPFEHKGVSKIVFDLHQDNMEAEKGTVNEGIEEVIRILNLHVAAGVPKDKIDAVVVFHGPAAASFLNNDMYNNRFKINNPNLALIQALKEKNVRFVVCGQTLGFRGLDISVFPAGTLKAYSARTAVSDFQQRGYAFYDISGQ